MATISIFSIRLGRLLLTCERDAVFSYVLTCQGVRSPMSTDVAAALGGAASRMILFEAVSTSRLGRSTTSTTPIDRFADFLVASDGLPTKGGPIN
jgi:hypothetical protein